MKQQPLSENQIKKIKSLFNEVSATKGVAELQVQDLVKYLLPHEKVQLYEIVHFSTDGITAVTLFTGQAKDIDIGKFGERKIKYIHNLETLKDYLQIRLTSD